MAVKLPKARETFLRAVAEFPRWMSIRKRPEKATSGLFLKSIIDEQTDVAEELDKFIKEFFMINYVGKESKTYDYVYIANVGSIDVNNTIVTTPDFLELTDDPKVFIGKIDNYILYQGGYLIISSTNLPDSGIINYTFNNYKYGSKLTRYHIWNIFDEFAMFLGLERFIEDNETNKQLLNRCFRVFTYPTNSTAKGLKNTILNCLSEDISLDEEDIVIETPDDKNMWLSDEDYDTIYERLIQLNKDIYRAKIWDENQWEHNFKELRYLSHQWDKELDVYQDGTGQNNDLLVTLSKDKEDTTNVTVRGFKKDTIKINEYFHKKNIRKEIPLEYIKYSNTLKPQNIQYRILATPAIKIAPESIYINEQTLAEGSNSIWLEDIASPDSTINVINPGKLEKDAEYKLEFRSDGLYSDMAISKCELSDDINTTDLLEEKGIFKFKNGKIINSNVKKHVTNTYELKSFNNLIDTSEGMAIGRNSTKASLTLDVTGLGGNSITIGSTSNMHDLTEQYDLWTLNGLKINDNKELYSDIKGINTDPDSATLELECMSLTYTLKKTNENQGMVLVKFYVNDKLDSSRSHNLNSPLVPGEPVTESFDFLTKVRIVFVKSGENPVYLENIKASKYKIEYSLTEGEIVNGMLSDVSPNKPNTLTLDIENYDVESPIINYIHIGQQTGGIRGERNIYVLDGIKPTTDNAYLNIDTTCLVTLYKKVGRGFSVDKNFGHDTNAYSTKNIYENNGSDIAYLVIDTSNFYKINSSSKKISKNIDKRTGKTVSNITFAPGERISKITISGTIFQNKARRSIKDLMTLEDYYNVYVAKNAKGFIIRNNRTNEEWMANIPRERFTDANTYTYEGLPEGMNGFFYVDRANEVLTIANSTDRNFEDTFIGIQDSDEYIAYNEIQMYKSTLGEDEDINIVNTFTPILDMNKLMFYYVDKVESDNGILNAVVSFKKFRHSKENYFCVPIECRNRLNNILTYIDSGVEKKKIDEELEYIQNVYGIVLQNTVELYSRITELLNDGNWTLGQKEIYITTGFDFNNSKSYSSNANTSSKLFSISNEISLDEKITINESEVDIAEYIVIPPPEMEVIYGEEIEHVENGKLVEIDGFNKLDFSNITEVEVVYVDSDMVLNDKYTILYKEGIIIWNDIAEMTTTQKNEETAKDELVGKSFYIAYKYKRPIGLRYKDLSYMYDMVNYATEAYLPIEIKSKIPTNLIDGSSFIVEFEEKVDYVPRPQCDNPNFLATYVDGTVSISRIYTDNVALVEAGYYYDSGNEYYMYNSDHVETIDKLGNIELHNVKKLDTIFQFLMATSNYLLNTDMEPGDNYEKLCYINFKEDKRLESKGISKLNVITTCETFNLWQCKDMNVSLTPGINGQALLFKPDTNYAYAILNITSFIKPGSLISMFHNNEIKAYIFKEIKVNDDHLTDSVYCKKFAELEEYDNFFGYQFEEDLDTSFNYYLIVMGAGIIDDIVIKDNAGVKDQFDVHVKNINKLDIKVDEEEKIGNLIALKFDTVGNTLSQLELASDNTISIGTNVKYGLTKVFSLDEIRNDKIKMKEFTMTPEIVRNNSRFISSDKPGTLKTPLFYVQNSGEILDLYVKINNVIINQMNNFNIKCYGCITENDMLRELGYEKKTNLAYFSGNTGCPYLQIWIEMPANKIIDNIEVFARYAEPKSEKKSLKIEHYPNGYIITKVFDTVESSSYRFKKLIGEVNDLRNFKLSMRALRQNERDSVWSDSFDEYINLNSDLTASGEQHIYDNYRLFQFKIKFLTPDVKANITDFVMEAV